MASNISSREKVHFEKSIKRSLHKKQNRQIEQKCFHFTDVFDIMGTQGLQANQWQNHIF